MTKLTVPTPCQTQPQTRPKPTPNIPKPTPNTAPSPPSQKSSSKPTFFPCAKLQVSFSPLSGSNRDGEEGKVLKRWSRMALGWLWDGSGMSHLRLGGRRKEGAEIRPWIFPQRDGPTLPGGFFPLYSYYRLDDRKANYINILFTQKCGTGAQKLLGCEGTL